MTLFWSLVAGMLLIAALAVCWPLYRQTRRLNVAVASAAILVMLTGGGLYTQLGSPGAHSDAGAMPSVEEMVASLEARLAENPQNLAGWQMLGRSHMQLQNFDKAAAAFERALAMTDGTDGQVLVALGEAVMQQQEGEIAGRPAELFEAALAAQPNNPRALFYGGIAAIARDEPLLAADRWEAVLALSPPPEIEAILRQRIDAWRGNESGDSDVRITVNVAMIDAAREVLTADSSVFIIARDPNQPSPPIAVARRKASELPVTVTLSDADAMIPGRKLSQFEQLEIVVRASLSGEPVSQPGDWYGMARIDVSEQDELGITIDRQVDNR